MEYGSDYYIMLQMNTSGFRYTMTAKKILEAMVHCLKIIEKKSCCKLIQKLT